MIQVKSFHISIATQIEDWKKLNEWLAGIDDDDIDRLIWDSHKSKFIVIYNKKEK